MRCGEMIKILEQLAPQSCACDWDNVGLLAGRRDKEVQTVWLALDATDQVAEMAAQAGADLLLTHHPLIFRPLKSVSDDDFVGRRLVKLLQNDISYYAMHTNFDAAPGCMGDLAADRLELKNQEVLELMGEIGGVPYGIGKWGVIEKALSLEALAGKVKQAFGLPFVTLYGKGLVDEPVTRIAVSPGSGGGMIEAALKKGAQVLVTGDIGHHDGIDGAARNLAIIDAGHYGMEYLFMDFMEKYLTDRLEGKVRILKSPVSFPADVV